MKQRVRPADLPVVFTRRGFTKGALGVASVAAFSSLDPPDPRLRKTTPVTDDVRIERLNFGDSLTITAIHAHSPTAVTEQERSHC